MGVSVLPPYPYDHDAHYMVGPVSQGNDYILAISIIRLFNTTTKGVRMVIRLINSQHNSKMGDGEVSALTSPDGSFSGP